MAGRPINTSKELAILTGLKTYEGLPHSRCGTTEKYVGNGGCVHCARQASLGGREARRLLKAQQAGEVTLFNVGPDMAIEPDAPDPAAFTKSLDDLM